MEKKNLRLSRPVYEALPWVYGVCGLFGLIVSYVERARGSSALLALAGLVFLIAGIVVLLRRRDFRDLREQYGHGDALTPPED